MKLIKKITDGVSSDKSKIRNAARIIAFDENNNIGILYVSKIMYHKLPGGGVENLENLSLALQREVKEELGSEIIIYGDIGFIEEYRKEYDLLQFSYCFYGKITNKGEPEFTEKELEQGFKIKWVKLDEAIELITNDEPLNYEGEFIKKRDLAFLKYYQENIKK